MKRKCNLLEKHSKVMGLGFLTECYVDGVKSTIMDGCPLLKQLVERVGNHPKVAEWNALHPNSHY